jgi:hypothetical protein
MPVEAPVVRLGNRTHKTTKNDDSACESPLSGGTTSRVASAPSTVQWAISTRARLSLGRTQASPREVPGQSFETSV